MSATATPVMPGQSDPFAALGGVYETPAPTAAPAPPPAAKPAADPFAGLGAQYEAPATPAPAPLRPPQAPFAPLPTQRIDMASLPAAPGPAPLPTQRIDMAATALNRSKNPEDQAPEVSYGFNRPWAKAGPYTTKLAPADEAKFQQWVKQNKVPWQDTPTSDYDMRGYWQAMQQGNATQQHSNFDGTMHYPDTWKTPYSGVFSRESMYATPEAPRWVGDRLVTRHGQIVTDETPRPQPIPAPAAPPKQPQTTQLPRPAGSPYWQGQVAEQGALLQYVPAPIKNFFTWANEKPLVDYAPDDSGQLTGPAQHAKQIWDGFQKDHPQIAAILDPVGAGEKYLARHPALAAAHDRLQQDLNAMTTPANVGMVAGGFFSKLGTISDVLAAVFTQQAVKGVYSSAKQAAQAYKEGNNPAAAALATDALFNATVAGLALHHGLNANAASEPEIAPGRVAQYRAQQAATRLVDEARPGGGPQEVVPDTDEQLRERAKSRIRAIADSGREQQVRVPGPDGQPKDVTIPARLLSRDELTEMRNLRQMLDDPASLRGYFWDLDHPKESSTAKAFDGLGAVYEPEASPTENVAQVSRGTSGEPGQRSVADVFGVPTPEENAAEDRRVRRQNEVRRIAAGAPPIGTEEPETGRTVMQQSPRPEVNQAAATAEHPAVKQTISDALEPIEGARLAGARDEKSPERVEEKIESEDQSPRTLRDYSGFRIAVDTPEARDQAAAALRQRFEVPDEQDEFDKGNEETGFHGMTLQVREPGSPVSHEVQILPREVAENADARHGLYEKAREGDKAAMARLKAQNEADYQRFRERNKILPAMAGEGGRGATPEPPAEGAAPVFKHGSTQANIPDESEAGKALAGLRSKIAPQDLAGDVNGTEGGLETHPHVTVRYGVKGDDTAGIERFIESQKPFEATLGATHSFPASEHSDGAVPIVAPVESPELHRINAEIEKHGAFAASSFPDYKPHATVAYVKPGTEGKYVNLSDAQGQRFPIDHISITDRNGNEKQVPLRGRGEEKGKQPEIISPDAERQATKALEDFDRRMLEKYGEDYHAPRDESPLTPEELREGDRLAVAEREARLRQGNYARPVAPETANAHITEGGISANAENKAAPGHLPTAAEGPFTEGSRVLRYDFNPDEAWVGFDLDKTLAHDEGFKGPEHIGEPIPEGVDRLKQLLDQGVKARILTARVAHDPDGMARATIEKWVKQHVGQELPITAVKDPNMIRLYDDRAATVEPNTGRLLAEPQEKIHALQERGPGGVLQRQPEEAGGAGGGRGRVEQGERGAEAAGAQPQLEGLGIPGGARPAETEVTPAADLRPNQVARVPVAELHADPKRFQYKMSATSAAGTSDLLHGRKWNDALAGVISVWRDPADGKVYVVNGHHRFELASGSGVPAMNVLMLEAPTAEAARSIGAMQNIAEGRGTPMDAAKFFRDSGFTPADLDRIGISMGEATAANGIALSRLADPIFDDVVTGKLRLNRAIAIGKATDVPEEQEAILKLVERAEARGRKVSDDTVDELARMAKGAGSHTDFQQTLFGTQAETRNLALEKAEVSSYIREQIGREKRIFGSVADEKKAAQLGSAGNRINAAKNREIATNAAQAQELYDRLSTRAGDVDTILNRAAQQLAEGKETPAAIKQRAYDDVRKALSETLTGRPQGGDRGIRAGTEAAPAVAAQRTPRRGWTKGEHFLVRDPATGDFRRGEVTFYNEAPNGGKPGGRSRLSDGTKLDEIPRDALRIRVPDAPPKNLTGTPEEAEVNERVHRNLPKLAGDYLERFTKDGVPTLATDAAKELLPEFKADPTGNDRIVANAGKAIRDTALDTVLSEPVRPGKDLVRITTASPGSGKTSGQARGIFDNAGLQIEAISDEYKNFASLLRKVIDSGRTPVVEWIHVDEPGKTVERMVRRALGHGGRPGIGRTVQTKYMADAYYNVPRVLEQVRDEFGDQVRFVVVDNSGASAAEATAHEGTEALQRFVDLRGGQSYNEIRNEIDAKLAELESEGVFEGDRGKAVLAAARATDRGSGSGSTGSRPGGASRASDEGLGRGAEERPAPAGSVLSSETNTKSETGETDEAGRQKTPGQAVSADEYARGIDAARKRSLRENAAAHQATVAETATGKAVVLDPDAYALWHRAGLGEKTAWKGVSLSREAANKLELMLRSMAGSARKEVGGAEAAAGYDRMATALREARQPDGSVMLLRGDYTPDTVLEEGWHQWQRRNKMAQSDAMHAVADRPEFREIADQLRAMGYGKGGREGRTEIALELMAKAMAGDPALKLTPDQRFELVHAFARAAAEEHGGTIFNGMPPVTPEAEAALREARHGYEAESDEAGRGGAARGAAEGRNAGVSPLAGSEGRAGDTRGAGAAGGRGQQGLPEGGTAEGELTPAQKQGVLDRLMQRVFHGSRFKFSKFSLDHIGRGEGMQAYGWGLYFAGDREVADWYRQKLTSHEELTPDAAATAKYKDQWDRVVSELHALDKKYLNGRPGQFEALAKARAPLESELASMHAKMIDETAARVGKGHLYTAEIPENDAMLDWDKPLAEQPEPVRDAIAAAFRERMIPTGLDENGKGTGYTGEQIYSELRKELAQRRESPAADPAKEASETLHKLGIQGIKYLDHGSRTTARYRFDVATFDGEIQVGDAMFATRAEAEAKVRAAEARGLRAEITEKRQSGLTHNYVVFDDNAIKVLNGFDEDVPLYQRAQRGLLPEDSLALPGMEQADEERAAAAGEEQGRLLSEEMRRPKGDISAAAGRMERESPLFFGSGENATLFGEPESPTEAGQMTLFQKGTKENPVAKSIQSLIDDLDKMKPEDERSAVERFSDWAGDTLDDSTGRAGAFWRRVPGLEKGLAHANAFVAALTHDFQASGEPSRLADKARALASGVASRVRAIGVPHPTDWKALLGEANVSRTEAALALRALKKSVLEAVPDKTARAAIKYWIEANGDPKKLNEWAQKAEQRAQWASGRKMDARLKDHYRESVAHYKAAATLDPQQREAAQRVKQHFDDLLKVWQENGLLYHAARNYVNHLYVRTGEAENLAHLIDLSELNPDPGFIKDRVFHTYFEAENHGLIPKSPDILDLMAAYDAAGNEALTTRTLLRNMLTAKNDAGKPLAVLNTSGRWIVAREDEVPQVMKRQEVPQDIDLRDYREFPELPQTRGFLFEPTAEDLKGFEEDPKLWEEDPSHIAFKGSLYFLKSEKGGVANQVEDMMTPGWFDRNQTLMQKIGHGALQLNALTKEVMTSLIPAPFHLFNVSQRVLEHWANPFRLPEIDMKDEVTRGLVANGLSPLDADAEGLMSARMLKGIFEGVPGVNVAMDRVHGFSQWLFRDWIPRAAVDLGKKAFEANTRIYGKEFEERALRELGPTMRNATEAERKAAAKDLAQRMLYELSAKQANHAVGMMNTAFDSMPRSKSTKQLMRLIFFAPEFLESTGRYVGQAALPHGRVQAVSLMRGAAMIYLAARGLNAAFNKGDAKWDKRHAFNVQIGDKDYGVRWALGDMVHMMRDPRNFAMNRLSSPFSAAFEFATGRNKYGQQRNFPDEVKDAVTRALPFQVQKVFTTPDVSLLETMLGASGIYPAKDRTPAEEMVHQVYVENIPDMPDDPERQARSRKNYQLEDELRNGKIKARDVLAKAEDHEITVREAWRIIDRAQQPRLVNEFMSAGLRFLPLRKGDPSILDVWKAATPQEKLELRPYLARKGESQLPEIDDPQLRASLVEKWRQALAEVPAEEEPPTVEPGQKVLASK